MGSWRPVMLPRRFAAIRQSRLVGRRNEFRFLEQAWSRVEAGDAQIVLIGGEPGAGKTRLTAEIAGALHDYGMAVLVGAAIQDGGVPYQPFVEMLDHLFLHSEPGSLADVLADAPFDLGRLSTHATRHLAPADDPVGDVRRDLFDALAQLFRRLARDHPLALVVDDLHWARLPTIALLEHIAHANVDTRMLLVATFRTTAPEWSEQLSERLADLHRLDGVHRLDLSGLDTDAIAEFLSDRAGITMARARTPAAILHDRTGGNPFFLRELWNDLERRGGIVALRGRQRVPASLGDTIGSRLAGLGAHARGIVDLAAVLGDTFDLGTLVRASDADRSQSIDAVDAATAVGLVEAFGDPPGRYGFVHSLTRQVIIDRLPHARLQLLHAKVAEVLDNTHAGDPALVPQIAHHYLSAHVLGYHARALHYTTLAAHQAARSLAYEEAALWFERAASLPESRPESVAELLFGSAENHVRAGDFARARALYDRLANIPDPQVQLRAAMGYEDANWRSGLTNTHAADLLAAALANTALNHADPQYVCALGSLSRALTFAGQTPKAREVGRRAIDLAQPIGDPATIVHTLNTSLWHGLTPDMVEVQLQRSSELSRTCLDLGDNETLGTAAHFRAVASYMSGRHADLDEAVRNLERSAQAVGQPLISYLAARIKQSRALLQGDFEGAEKWVDVARQLGMSFDAEGIEGPFGVHMFMIRRETRGLDVVREHLTGRETFTGRWVPGLLALYTELDLTEGVQRTLRYLLNRDLTAHTIDAQWPMELAFMIEGALALRDVEAARTLRPFVASYAGMNLVTGEFVAFGSADRYLGATAALLGEQEIAEQHFANALELDRRMGSLIHVAQTLARHALAVHAAGRDPKRAQDLARQAQALAAPIGQARILRWLQPVLPSAGPNGLTEREVEVLRLLAEGLSNSMIGARLYISANTVANHVRNILTKTGAANRTQAARYATEKGLA